MKETTSQAGTPAQRLATGPIIIALAALILLLVAGGYAVYSARSDGSESGALASANSSEVSQVGTETEPAAGPVAVPEVTRRITVGELEEQYGLRLRLLAVTAAGGLIDLRLKVIDAEKASQLLGSNEPLPTIIVEESGVALQAPADHDLKLEDGIMVFGLYPNRQHAVDTGTAVSVQFGSMSLGPIIAQ
ncbi:MAG: hypothetical protein PVH65_02455 [Chloroflexota bacterium]|jgi:hypothetical protein